MRTPITRRTALRTLAGAAALTTLPRSRAATASTPAPAAAPMPATSIRQSVCKWCFRDIPIDTFAKAAKEIGLVS
ncbi:MAG: hydroxypyruvate isomerase, partial [Opitutaceae bacterium]